MTAPAITRGAGRGLRFISVCSGIEAASVALEPLGFVPAAFAEIDKAASALLARRFPHVRNFGDFTAIDPREVGPVDWLIGGTPCQAFSIAGKRFSLADARGNLTLAYAVLAHELARHNGLRGCLWENVPGVLNTPDNAFGCFLGALVGSECALIQPRGTGWPHTGMVDGPRARAAWRVLDAQYFGLAQRRERVFVVIGFGDRIDPAKILFERAGLRGNSTPSREARKEIAGTLAARTRGGGGLGTDFDLDGGLIAIDGQNVSECGDIVGTLQTVDPVFHSCGFDVAHSLRGEGSDASEDGTGRGTPIVPVAFNWQGGGTQTSLGFDPQCVGQTPAVAFSIQERAVSENPDAGPDGIGVQEGISYTLEARSQVQAVAFDTTQITSATNRCNPQIGDPCHPLAAGAHPPALAFDLRGREGGAQFEGPHDTANIRAASGGSSRSYVAQVELQNQGSGGNRGYAEIDEPAFTLNTHGPSGIDDSRWAVRRLTPTECERLQGFPDGWTDGQADGPRYRQLGNSMAVPVIRWVGERILASEAA